MRENTLYKMCEPDNNGSDITRGRIPSPAETNNGVLGDTVQEEDPYTDIDDARRTYQASAISDPPQTVDDDTKCLISLAAIGDQIDINGRHLPGDNANADVNCDQSSGHI